MIGVILAFIAVSVWWLTQNQRVPDSDDGTHLLYALTAETQLTHGQLGALFNTWDLYPPFGAIVGAVGFWIGGSSPMAAILAANIFFVPLLAVACYGIGTLVYGTRLAGLLAAIFALGTPMFVSEMHVLMLDPQEAAMVAVTVWAVLASRGFSRPGVAALAGVAGGLAVMTKQTAVVFIAGPILIALLRGGWRSWRGILACAILAGVIAGPWYVSHLGQIRLESASDELTKTSAYASPPRFSRESLTWYFWNALNIQILLPLCAFFAIGVLMTLHDWLPRPKASDLRIDLLAGCFLGWLGATMIVHKDPRYSLPELVYIAVLGSGWVATLARRRLRAFSGNRPDADLPTSKARAARVHVRAGRAGCRRSATVQDARRRRERLCGSGRCRAAVRADALLLPGAPSRLLQPDRAAEPGTGRADRAAPA